MTTEIINALNAKFNADKLTAFANLTNYMNNSAAVGEHPDIVAEAEKLVAAIADADGKLQTLSQLLPKKVEETVAETK
jgi:hypothetical protein|tara:strand:+ start:3487 stop:3720 length:234 start_codon:yes stop_codon:yes gene_type:complete